ncbi:receptor-type tyrosine-protein phosphatase H isoform X3 [Kryptolebias marmoratus]|uniref:receptor-type tyrosine-protein phosphatase H isoform X3 n=1 Tax=Kryptolebias marmoratus TaxID=37003 RepID=UPI0018AD0DA1|nr:receptor-type tyrosine-protein phosphatase H isoform X3 [Kryptolebias marmoratus]
MMRHISFKSTSDFMLLSVALSLLLLVTECNSASTSTQMTVGTDSTSLPSTATTTTTTTTATTTTKPPPGNVGNVTVVTQNESSITLQWEKVDNILTYILLNINDDRTENVSASSEGTSVTHVVSGLEAGKKYNFTLYTVEDGLNSSGRNITAVTAPVNVGNVTVVTRNESSITLQWDKVEDILKYKLQYTVDGKVMNVTVSGNLAVDTVETVVSGLTAGREYNFTVFTVFEGVDSSGYHHPAPTAPVNVRNVTVVTQNESSITLQWDKVEDILKYKLQYKVDGKVINVTVSGNLAVDTVETVVSGLTAGREYNFTVFTVFKRVDSSGYHHPAPTAPGNVGNVTAVTQDESSITLQWDKVEDILKYKLQYEVHGSNKVENVPACPENSTVRYVISNLTAGREYNFTVFTVFKEVNSSGYHHPAATVPLTVSSVRVTERSLNSSIIKWEILNQGWEYHVSTNATNASTDSKNSSNTMSYTVSNLQPGTLYSFSVITHFSGLNSTAYNGFILTQIDCESVTWRVTNTSIQGTVKGVFSKASATFGPSVYTSSTGRNVSFTDLSPGATYVISLEHEIQSTLLSQCVRNASVTIIPPWLTGHCKNWGSGYSARIIWDNPAGVWQKVRVNMSDQSYLVNQTEKQLVINGLQPAKTYKVSLVSLSGSRCSESSVFLCNTDNRGVIAGSVMGVLLFCVLACVFVLIFLKRPDIISRKKSFIAGSRKAGAKGKVISVAKFPDHFYQMSLDENRGFSQEYEELASVGTDQTRKAATLPENKGKNRFTNILPYDWCRVKLNTSSPSEILDYINASYMPGYDRNREYIASQGPLPSTVKDFWRMIWEQRVRGIVMVTNCTEAGRTKCEHYWPEDQRPCLHGELLVTLISEQKEPNWTLREFRVKNKNNSEERSVKHFHFTAWPDHGVPQGTEVLIQFRGLVRRHIESEETKAPTVVHCSAGVGRTGTIIALDVLLQQLQKEHAVSINDFVHRMRQHRSHMVQTESQYVFLHQCIMDSLQQNEKQEENIYENADMIYANATALREFHNHKTNA